MEVKMSKSLIIYGTNYGTAKRYAGELAKRTGIQAVSYEKIEIPKDCEMIIYLGGLYAGGVKGLKETLPAIYKTSYKKFVFIYAVFCWLLLCFFGRASQMSDKV